jgi:hypothetical protein
MDCNYKCMPNIYNNNNKKPAPNREPEESGQIE